MQLEDCLQACLFISYNIFENQGLWDKDQSSQSKQQALFFYYYLYSYDLTESSSAFSRSFQSTQWSLSALSFSLGVFSLQAFSLACLSLDASLCFSELFSLFSWLSYGDLQVDKLQFLELISESLQLDSALSLSLLPSSLNRSIIFLKSSCCLICASSFSFLYKALSFLSSYRPPLAHARENLNSSSKTGLSSIYLMVGIFEMIVFLQCEIFLVNSLLCMQMTAMLGIFSSTSGKNSSVSILLLEISRALIDGQASRPTTSSRPAPPILLPFSCRFDKLANLSSPSTFSIRLSLRLRLASPVSVSKPSILQIIFSCRYRHLRLTRFSRPSIFLKAFPSIYRTLRPQQDDGIPVYSSRLSILVNPLQCRQRMSLRQGVEQQFLKSVLQSFLRNSLEMTPLSSGLGFRCIGSFINTAQEQFKLIQILEIEGKASTS